VRPGIIPLRPLSVGEILDGAFTAMRRYPRVTLGLAAAIAAIQQLLGLIVDLTTGNLSAPAGSVGISRVGGVSTVILWAIGFVFSAALAGMITVVIGDAVLGRPITAGAVWQRIRPFFWRLVGAAFVTGLLTVLGLFACLVGALFPWVAFAFTTPALLLERLGVGQALRRSWRLTLPSFWRLLGIRLLAALIASVIADIAMVPALIALFAALNGSGSEAHIGVASEAVIRLSGLVATTLTAPFTAGVIALLYIDRRMRAEALDMTLVRAAAAPA